MRKSILHFVSGIPTQTSVCIISAEKRSMLCSLICHFLIWYSIIPWILEQTRISHQNWEKILPQHENFCFKNTICSGSTGLEVNYIARHSSNKIELQLFTSPPSPHFYHPHPPLLLVWILRTLAQFYTLELLPESLRKPSSQVFGAPQRKLCF